MENFDKMSLPKKEEFYSNLNIEDITDTDYMHAKRVCKDFEINNFGEYHGLFLKSDTWLSANVFENSRKIWFEIFELGHAKFPSSLGLAWQTAFKKTDVKLVLITDTEMLLIVQKGIRGGMCQSINRYVKASYNYMKDYDKKSIIIS